MTNIITELTQAIQSIYPHRDSLRLNTDTTPSSPDTLYPALRDMVVRKLNSPYFRNQELTEVDADNEKGIFAAHHQMFNFLKESLPDKDVRIGPDSQFPDLGYLIHFGERQFDYINSTCGLHVRISLLGDYYTVYFLEIVRMFYKESPDPHKSVSLASFVSANNEFVDSDQNITNTIKGAVNQFFPEHKFIQPNILFKRNYNQALPYRRFSICDYAFYEFFFGYCPPKPIVVRFEFSEVNQGIAVTGVVLSPPSQ